MSRSKRTRKGRMRVRQQAHLERVGKGIEAFKAFNLQTIERARLRGQIEASDAPDAVKTTLSMLIDPIGFVLSRIKPGSGTFACEPQKPKGRHLRLVK